MRGCHTEKEVRQEVPRTASCASASLHRRKKSPEGIGRQEREKSSAMPRRREISRRSSRERNQAQVKKNKHSTVLHTMCRLKAMVPRCSIVRLEKKDLKPSVVNAWQISSFCHFLVARPSRLTEPSVFKIENPQDRIDIRRTLRELASPSENKQM